MHLGRAALGLAAVATVLACSHVSGLAGFTFDGRAGGGGGHGVGGNGGISGAVGGSGGQGQGGFTAVDSSAASMVSSVNAGGAASSAISSTASGSGGARCAGSDIGVCCPDTPCGSGESCCQLNGVFKCQVGACGSGNWAVKCDDSADCSFPDACCSQYDSTGQFDRDFACQLSCTHPSNLGQPGDYEICSLSDPHCISGSCQPLSPLPNDYGVCF